jgi:hypothetical protein
MKPLIIGIFLGVFSGLLGSAGAMNLFTNPSFETGAGGVTFSPTTDFGGATALELTSVSSEIPGWTWEQDGQGRGAAWLQDTGNLFGSDGNHLIFLDTNQAIQWQDAGGQVVAGESYAFDYNFATWERGQDLAVGDPSSGEGTISLDYNYRNGTGDLMFGTFMTNLRPPENGDAGPGALVWLSGSQSLVIPADVASDFNFSVTTSGTGMLIDNLALTAVPEPGMFGLLGLGALLLGLRRRA